MELTPVLMVAPALLGLLVLIAIAVFFWKRNGAGSGRSFGNRIASHLGIKRSVFHALMDVGSTDPSRKVLSTLEQSGWSVEQAAIQLAPALSKGIERMDARFGPQQMIDEAKPIVARLLAQHGQVP